MPKTFGEVLKKARKTLGMKANEAARLIGISQSVYSKYENDKIKNVSIDFVKKVHSILGIDANQLFNINNIEFDNNKTEKLNETKKLIEQFEVCLNETRKLKIAELDEYLTKISESEKILSIRYEKIVFTTSKLGSTNFIGLCCIIVMYTSEMLQLIDKVAEEKEGLDGRLANLYVLYKNLMINILIK